MKRTLLIILILIMIITTGGCKSPINETNSEDITNSDNELNNIEDNDNLNDKESNLIEVELPNAYRAMEIKNYSVSDNLERISLKLLEGEGIPSIILKDPSEYKNKNPWFNNKDIEVLPVFKNKTYNLKYHEGPLEYLTEEESIEVSLLVAERLGMDTSKYECEGFGESYVIYFPNKNEPIVEIMPSIDEIVVFFDPYNNGNISLPNINEYHEDILYEKYLVYYYNTFESILRMEQPVFESSFERDIFGEKMYTYKIFNQEDTVEDTIVNYSTDYVRIYINVYESDIDYNGLSGIILTYRQLMNTADSNEYENTIIERLAKRSELEIVGYYPLISEEEAIEKVLSKEFISTIEYDREIELSDIMSMELVYYWAPVNKEIQPVYKVYLDLNDTSNYDYFEYIDLNLYGIFYVPAIESKYLDISQSN